MTWAYCANTSCGCDLGYPTAADAIVGEQECPKCEAVRPLSTWERRMVLSVLNDLAAEREAQEKFT